MNFAIPHPPPNTTMRKAGNLEVGDIFSFQGQRLKLDRMPEQINPERVQLTGAPINQGNATMIFSVPIGQMFVIEAAHPRRA